MNAPVVDYLIRFEPSGRTVRVPVGTSLLQAARMADLPVAAACGEYGICGRCGLEILAGADALPPEPDSERKIKSQNRVEPGLRLSCHLEVVADLVVTAPYW